MYYGVFQDEELIALHDDKRVVFDFYSHSCTSGTHNYKIAKIKDKHLPDDYDDLVLVRYRGSYVPLYLYSTVERCYEDSVYEYKEAQETLFKLLEVRGDEMTPHDIKHIKKTIKLLGDFTSEYTDYDLDSMREEKELYQRYRHRVDG
jgi:hypothetical protein